MSRSGGTSRAGRTTPPPTTPPTRSSNFRRAWSRRSTRRGPCGSTATSSSSSRSTAHRARPWQDCSAAACSRGRRRRGRSGTQTCPRRSRSVAVGGGARGAHSRVHSQWLPRAVGGVPRRRARGSVAPPRLPVWRPRPAAGGCGVAVLGGRPAGGGAWRVTSIELPDAAGGWRSVELREPRQWKDHPEPYERAWRSQRHTSSLTRWATTCPVRRPMSTGSRRSRSVAGCSATGWASPRRWTPRSAIWGSTGRRSKS